MLRFLSLVVSLLLALPAAAQSVDEIITKNLEARGGEERLKAVQSVRYTARVPFGRQPGSVFDETGASRNMAVMIVENQRPNLSRSTMLMPGFSQLQYEQALRNNMTPEPLQSFAAKEGQKALQEQAARGNYAFEGASMVSGFDGQTFWMWNSQQGGVRTRSLERPPAFSLDGPFMDNRAKGATIELLGKSKAEGKSCLKLKLTAADGSVHTYYLDEQTFLEVVVESELKNVRGKTRITYADWKDVNGIKVAHRIIQTTGGFTQPVTIDKVEFNVRLDEAHFAPPREK